MAGPSADLELKLALLWLKVRRLLSIRLLFIRIFFQIRFFGQFLCSRWGIWLPGRSDLPRDRCGRAHALRERPGSAGSPRHAWCRQNRFSITEHQGKEVESRFHIIVQELSFDRYIRICGISYGGGGLVVSGKSVCWIVKFLVIFNSATRTVVFMHSFCLHFCSGLSRQSYVLVWNSCGWKKNGSCELSSEKEFRSLLNQSIKCQGLPPVWLCWW